MLLSQEDAFELLRCPRTGRPLKRIDSETLVAASDERAEYRIVRGCPVLVDFDDSVLTEQDFLCSDAQSVVKRRSYGGASRILKRLVSPPTRRKTTAANVSRMMGLLKQAEREPRVLVIGGGGIGQGIEGLYDDPDIKTVAFDIYASEHVQFVADAHRIPLPNDSFDGAIIQAVLEHVLDPNRVVAEIHRVLKSNAIVYAETPFLQHVHEGAYDFSRFTESGHRYLFKDFERIVSGATAGPGTQLLWSIDYFFRSLFRSRRVGKAFKLLFCWLQLLDGLVPESYQVDAASGVFFLGRKRGTAMGPAEIIEHYQGAQRGDTL